MRSDEDAPARDDDTPLPGIRHGNAPQNALVARDAEAQWSIALDNKIASGTGCLGPIIASGRADQQVAYEQPGKGS